MWTAPNGTCYTNSYYDEGGHILDDLPEWQDRHSLQ